MKSFSIFDLERKDIYSLMISLIAPKDDGTLKDTVRNLLETRNCVVNFVTDEILKAMKITAKEFEHSIDEFNEAKLTKIPSELIKAKRVKESIAQFECELIDLVNVSDRLESLIEHSIFGFNTELQPGSGNLAVCKILKVHFTDSLLREGTNNKIDVKKYHPIARLGAKFYTKVSDKSIFM